MVRVFVCALMGCVLIAGPYSWAGSFGSSAAGSGKTISASSSGSGGGSWGKVIGNTESAPVSSMGKQNGLVQSGENIKLKIKSADSGARVPALTTVNVVTNIVEHPDAIFKNGLSLRCLDTALNTDKGFDPMNSKIEVKNSQGETKFVDKSQVWLRGTGLVEAPGLGLGGEIPGTEQYLGGMAFDHYAIRSDKLYETQFTNDDQAWDDPVFMAGSGVILASCGEGLKSPSGEIIGANEGDIYVFDSVSIPLADKTVNVPVMSTFNKVHHNKDYQAVDQGAFAIQNSGWEHIHRENAYAQVTLQDGSLGVVSLDAVSTTPSSDRISVTDKSGNSWYVRESAIDTSEETLNMFQI